MRDLRLVAQCLNGIPHSRQHSFIITTTQYDSFNITIPFLQLAKVILNFVIMSIKNRAAEESVTFETVSLCTSKLARYFPCPQLAPEIEEVYAG